MAFVQPNPSPKHVVGAPPPPGQAGNPAAAPAVSKRFTGPRRNASITLEGSKADRIPSKEQLCASIRVGAAVAKQAADRGSRPEVGAACTRLTDVGRAVLSGVGGKHQRAAIAALLREFDNVVALGFRAGDLQHVAETCRLYSRHLDSLVGIERPAGKDPVDEASTQALRTKKAYCSRIKERAGQLEALVRQGECSSEHMKTWCRFLAADGQAILSLANGKALRPAIADAIGDFQRETVAVLAAGDLAAMAQLCVDYAKTLEELVGIEKPRA